MSKGQVTIIAGVLALVAAGLWMASTLVKVSAADADKPDAQGWYPAQTIDEDGNEVLTTSRRQAKWNQRAALASCLAAAAQAWAMFMPAG